MIILRERIKRFEGTKKKLYYDSEGNLTGGYGHNFSSKGIPPRILNKYYNPNWVFNEIPETIIDELLDIDIEDCFYDLVRIFDLKNFGCKNDFCLYNEIDIEKALLPKQVVYVLVDMMFNMGKERFMGFKNMIDAVDKKDWRAMALEIRDSVYWNMCEDLRLLLVNKGVKRAYNRAQMNIDLVLELVKIC